MEMLVITKIIPTMIVTGKLLALGMGIQGVYFIVKGKDFRNIHF